MKLFDYKFIILFGLTFVMYFIYREIEYLRAKIYKLEGNILNNKINDTNFDFSFIPIKSPKIINVDLTKNDIVISESETTMTSKHVAIYSNDNEQHIDNTCSLLEEIKEANETKEEIKKVSETKKTTENKEEIKKVSEIKEETKYDRESLMKLNLDRLKKIANEKKISITKENGKYKLKKELIDNILE
jgi:hypothetical protein